MILGLEAACVLACCCLALREFLFLYEGRVIRQGTADQVREETGKSLDELFREVFKCLPNC